MEPIRPGCGATRGLGCMLILVLALAVAARCGVAQAKLYDRDDRARRVQRGEKLPWNTLDDYYGYPVADPDYHVTGIYSWASALQACFSLAGYDTSQEAVIFSAFGADRDSWYFAPTHPPPDAYGPGGAAHTAHFHCSVLPGHYAADQVISCIDHGSPVVLLLDSTLPGGDPLVRAGRQPRYVTVYGYAWDSDGRLPVRTLLVDVYDPQGAHGDSPGSVRLPLNDLTQAWAGTLTGSLVNGRGRLGISRVGGV